MIELNRVEDIDNINSNLKEFVFKNYKDYLEANIDYRSGPVIIIESRFEITDDYINGQHFTVDNTSIDFIDNRFEVVKYYDSLNLFELLLIMNNSFAVSFFVPAELLTDKEIKTLKDKK